MTDAFTWVYSNLNLITSVMVACTGSVTMYSLWSILHFPPHRSRPVSYLSGALFLLILIVILRTLYWDLSQHILPAWWTTYIRFSTLGSVPSNLVNATLNLLAMLSLSWVLTAVWLFIPAEERDNWTLVTAPFYPNNKNRFVRVVHYYTVRRKKEITNGTKNTNDD